jgi:glycosyltransferase involved in cell wall biosynthesis
MTPINDPQKKILFVTRPLSPPWDEASKNFAFDLAKNVKNHTITILVDKEVAHVPPHIIQEKIYTKNDFSIIQKFHLVRYLLTHAKNFDVIHLLFTPTKVNSWLMQKILGNKNVKIVQTIATVRDDLYTKKDLKEMFFGNALVTYSQWAQNKLKNIGFTNARHIYPGINLSRYTPSEKKSSLMRKWQIDPTDKIITYPGEFTRLGATDLIIDAFIDLWEDVSNAHIKYLCACRIKNASDAQKKQELIQKLKNVGHADKVIFTDTFEDMNAVYNLSDIIIFPVTTMRGKFDVPLAMIEPYACKKPVITSDLSLFKEFSSPAINAIIPKANSTALKNMILELLNDPEKRKILGENAYTFAHETFNIHKIARSYENIYEKL